MCRREGKGKVVYLAAGIDAGLWSYAYPYQRRLLARAIAWAAPERPPLAVSAPMCVQATYWTQADGDARRLIVHLFNGVNTAANHGLPASEVPLREEVVPIHDIRVTFGPGYRFRRMHLEPEGKELKMEKTAKGTQVTIPKLEVHSMVVGELDS